MSLRAKTPEEYVSLIEQVIDELDDIREVSGYAFDDDPGNLSFVDVLMKDMRELRASMADGSYQFGRNDLPYMRIVKKLSELQLPCIRLLYMINQTHREGLGLQGARHSVGRINPTLQFCLRTWGGRSARV